MPPKIAISTWWTRSIQALVAAGGEVQHVQGEVRALAHADRRADQGEPGQHHLADLLDPGEADRIDVEPVRHLDHDVAQEDADQQVDDRGDQQEGDDDLRDVGDEASGAIRAPTP